MKRKPNLVYDARKRLGLTQKELAELLGLATNYIYMMERERKPVSDSVRVSIEELEKSRQYNITATGSAVAINGSTATNHPTTAQADICAECAVKDAEIKRLNKIIDRLLG